jgi:hypothetical protein
MKKAVMSLLVWVAVAAICHAATISITFPNGGEQLPLKKTVTVTWTLMGYPTSPYAKLVLFKGGTDSAHKVGNIVKNIHITYGENFVWQVGSYEGGFAGIGDDYYLRIISMNGDSDFSDFSNNPFSIVLPKIPIERYREYVELNPDPGCPMCGVFDIGDLLEKLGHPSPDVIGDLVILRGGRQVGLLGKLGRGGLSSNQTVKLQFGAEDFSLLGQQNQGFEVAIMGAQGNILKRQAISLKMRQ